MLDSLFNNPLIALFAAIGLGMALGRISIAGLSLGSSGVLFVALLLGHFGYHIPGGVGTVGLVLFVYCVGIGAGGRFFTAIARQGSTLALLALIVVGLGATLSWALGSAMDLPPDLAAGLFAGALTSTPALAAATDALGANGPMVPIGYGIAYPFGVIGVVIFVQLLPRLLKLDLDKAAAEAERTSGTREAAIVQRVIEVTNENLVGQKIAESSVINSMSCQVTRIVREGRLAPLDFEDTFAPGQKLLLVGREDQVQMAADFIGVVSQDTFALDSDRERRQLILKSKQFAGKSMRDLNILREYNIIVSRITRLGFTFVPKGDTVLENNDVVTAVGTPDALRRFSEAIGHRSQAFDETDLLSLGIGLTAGVVLGLISLHLPGGTEFSLGLAGGPLVVGLILGHFGRVGAIIGHIPRPTRLLLQELGLVLFLADAGIKGGGAFIETLHEYGAMIFLLGAVVTLVPLLVALPIATRLMKMNILQALGGICGGMTSTPALGALTAKTDSQAPVVSYATAYPVALILMTFFAKGLIDLLS